MPRTAAKVRADGVDELVEEERGEVGVVLLHIHHHRLVIPTEAHRARARVIQVGERDPVLCTYWSADDELVDVIELVPILIACLRVPACICAYTGYVIHTKHVC